MTRPALVDGVAALLGARTRVERPAAPGVRPAAVLVPLVAQAGGVAVLFTVRSADLPDHAGQTSFPGGMREEGDPDATATALRETTEEIGLDPGLVESLGLLDDFETPTGFCITPVVGWIAAPPAAYRPSPREVAEVFTVPWTDLADPAVRHDLGLFHHGGRSFPVWAYRPGGRNIWGVTARIVGDLLALVGN